ncbi:hypothetical protein JHK87_010313 [Glycine soja]|nr:hypothetical protein JHK87_010313 [Glycine soja]
MRLPDSSDFGPHLREHLRVRFEQCHRPQKRRSGRVLRHEEEVEESRFADAFIRELAEVTIPPERIYGLGTGFVEDRLATLKNVIKEPELDQWNLYLGNWGYNTQKEREEVAAIPRIHVLELSDFSKKLK